MSVKLTMEVHSGRVPGMELLRRLLRLVSDHNAEQSAKAYRVVSFSRLGHWGSAPVSWLSLRILFALFSGDRL